MQGLRSEAGNYPRLKHQMHDQALPLDGPLLVKIDERPPRVQKLNIGQPGHNCLWNFIAFWECPCALSPVVQAGVCHPDFFVQNRQGIVVSLSAQNNATAKRRAHMPVSLAGAAKLIMKPLPHPSSVVLGPLEPLEPSLEGPAQR